MLYNTEICNVLVVDDEIGMTMGIQKSLKKFVVTIDDNNTEVTFNVQTALTSQEFYKAFDNNHFDIVLLDYKLPNVTGLELLDYIMQKKESTLVIMITAYASFETAVQSTKLGAYDFLAKPFGLDELKNAVKKATTHLVLAKQARSFEEEKKKIRFQFISVLAHELKAPLNAIEGYVDIMTGRYDTISEENYNKMLSRSKIRIDGMRKLIFDLLDLTRIESGEKKRTMADCDLFEIVKASIDMMSYDAKQKNISIDLKTAKSIMLYADKSEIDIVINNLISNAIKYNVENGKVAVKIKDYNDKIRLIVADCGIGISKKDQPRLFNEFVRIKNNKTLHILGSGLGLSTLKKIVKLYDGSFKLRSTPDKGSVFIVEFKKSINKV